MLPRLAACVALAALSLACSESRPADAGAGGDDAVDARNLLASERYWPYRVALREAWQAPGRDEPLPPGLVGVLIRVEASGLPRIDFGRIGKYEVPLDHTDLLARANRIREGAEPKAEPNFVHAIKSRLLDPAAEAPRPLPAEQVEDRSGFLCVFADPGQRSFEALARALAPLHQRHGVMTLLFAQGEHPDAALAERLRALAWPAPFLRDYLSEPYSRTLLRAGTPLPYLMLQTPEGRVLFEGEWRDGIETELGAALEAGFGAAPAASARA
jgi:hypothetical protein